ncbi:MAG: hypothetical protein IJE07_03675 [Clostridia bacterium]|nr:hypothetical protein [Clostridia bacterium]
MLLPKDSVLKIVRDFLERTDIHYKTNEYTCNFNMSLNSRLNQVQVEIRCYDGLFIVYATAPLHASPDKRDDVMSFITYANYGLQRGNFEMDQNDGEIRYKDFLSFGEVAPSSHEVTSTISIPMLMMNRYGDGLINVMFGNADPEEACKACEQ